MKAILAALMLAAMACPAAAQLVVTLPRQTPALMEKALSKYGESTIGAGIDPQQRPVTLQVNPKDGSFSVLMRAPPGVICLVAAGKGWTAVEPTTAGQGL